MVHEDVFEPSEITKALTDERARVLEKLAKGSRDDFDYNRGLAEGLRVAGVTISAMFERITGSDPKEARS